MTALTSISDFVRPNLDDVWFAGASEKLQMDFTQYHLVHIERSAVSEVPLRGSADLNSPGLTDRQRDIHR